MAALEMRMTIPLGSNGDAGHVSLAISVPDLDQLDPDCRQVLADTGREFAEFAARTLAPAPAVVSMPAPPEVHDPNGSVLAGVTGTRRNTS